MDHRHFIDFFRKNRKSPQQTLNSGFNHLTTPNPYHTYPYIYTYNTRKTDLRAWDVKLTNQQHTKKENLDHKAENSV